ncbi:MAG: hypothetical protein R2712_20790 [Vicinamibacterales bacterium]
MAERRPRIRAVDERTAALVAAGLERSAILRALVNRIDAGHVIVYVSMNPRMTSGLAGCVTFQGAGGGYRYLRASLNPDLPPDQLLASLAHELHHVVEVMDHPEVRSEAGLVSLYKRIGHQSRVSRTQGWETDAARQVGASVRRELKAGATTALARRPTAAQAQFH